MNLINYIITDETWYDFKAVFYLFGACRYKGLLVMIDELVNIYKIPHSATRQNNYEKILTMYNDALQGKASHIGFLLGATPQCMEDTYRGVFSYEALRSRLSEGRFAGGDMKDILSPIIRLHMLTQDEVYVLIEKLMHMYAQLFDYTPKMTHDDIVMFLNVEYNRISASTHISREIIRDFIGLANILYKTRKQPRFGFKHRRIRLRKSEEQDSLFTEFEL